MNKAFIFIPELYCIPILQDHINEMTCILVYTTC